MTGAVDVPTPREAGQTGLRDRPDSALPLIAATWIAQGLDSPELRELAGLGQGDGADARRLRPVVLRSLGYPLMDRDSPWDDLPWRGYWGQILWNVREIDFKLTPLVAAQRVLEVLGDVPDLWGPGGGDDLQRLVADWSTAPSLRPEVDDALRHHLRPLREDQVPPQMR